MFEQRHEPGREGAFDFTDCTELGITIAGQVFVHLLFQFVLSFSKWRWVGLAFSETFEALVHGLQDALMAIGARPRSGGATILARRRPPTRSPRVAASSIAASPRCSSTTGRA